MRCSECPKEYDNPKSLSNYRRWHNLSEYKLFQKSFSEKVKIFNVKIKRIPTVIIANMLGYTEEQFFESKPGTEEVPVVDFG